MVERINEDGQRYYVVEILADVWENAITEGLFSRTSYIMKDEKIRNERYPDDPQWATAHKQIKDGYKARDERAKELRDGGNS